MSERKWHPNFIKYVNFIINHPNYYWLFVEKKEDWIPKWVVAWKSENWLKRRAWWDKRCNEHWIKIEAWCYAKIALLNHPTQKHTCQICWKELSIKYIYPNKRSLTFINKSFNLNIDPFTLDIYEIINNIKNNSIFLSKFQILFKKDKFTSYDELLNIVNKYVLNWDKWYFSPWAMSNSPDRFDWYHSDWACCRHESDKWRHKDNLQRYTQDRRVYENWVEWDWKKADRLMAMFAKSWVSADHIWPISLWFCHRPKFTPMSKEDNSSKWNRMSFNDVKILIEDEKTEKVMSWYWEYLWDNLKNKVIDDKGAKKLSDLLSKNTQISLNILSIIHKEWYSDFLIKTYLYPDYSFFDHRIIWFNPEDWTYENIETKEVNRQEQHNNVQRYIRIALETLEIYSEKENRKNIKYIQNIDHWIIKKIFLMLDNKDYKNADLEVRELVKYIWKELIKEW